jgi:hypothetical protein
MNNIRKMGWLMAGLVMITAGYVSLAGGDTVAAPLLLILGYCVLIPVALLRSFIKASGE